MTPEKPDDKMLVRRREMAAARESCLGLPPEEALEQILAYHQPAALVHAFPEEDLHLLIREIGPDDALPLMALASHKQLEYLLDQEMWQRDRLDLEATTQWLERLLRADPSPQRMIRWLAEEKTDLVELVLFRSIEVRMREHDQDPSVFGPDFFSYDNVFYIRILSPATGPDQETETALSPPQQTIKRLLDHLAESDYVRFQAILLEAVHVLPAETEEEQYRLRIARLAEKGFLPFEEAVGLYQSGSQAVFRHRALRRKPLRPEHPDLYALVPMSVLPARNLFAHALEALESPDQRQALQEEFAALCNRIIVADQRKIDSRDDLAAVVAKASGYLHLGLQTMPPEGTAAAPDVQAAVRDLSRYHLEGLFRLGYREAVALKQTAEAWVHQSWFAGRSLPLTFWGEIWLGVIGGLLIKRPLFFDNYDSGTLYREFADLEEIVWSRRQIHQMQHIDRLLDRLDPVLPTDPAQGFLTYKSLLLTLWARHWLHLPEALHPIALEDFRPFFKHLFRRPGGRASGGEGGRIADALRRNFLTWLADRTRQPAGDLTQIVGSTLEALFAELEKHYGRVRDDRLDPRYVPHFLLEPKTPSHPR